MVRISDAIGYDVEVSEPNGPTVHGYITDRWAKSRQPEFDRWLAEHDRGVAARAWYEGFSTSDRCWAETYDLTTPDEDRTDPRNPYHTS